MSTASSPTSPTSPSTPAAPAVGDQGTAYARAAAERGHTPGADAVSGSRHDGRGEYIQRASPWTAPSTSSANDSARVT